MIEQEITSSDLLLYKVFDLGGTEKLVEESERV